ncbi:MAG TPA: hypothetical protein VMW11_08235, partial [Candidatus Dormibacteraeota bacterium]|nr:hypothetical protein [Candidatus Dormibacteraeota bacterium]
MRGRTPHPPYPVFARAWSLPRRKMAASTALLFRQWASAKRPQARPKPRPRDQVASFDPQPRTDQATRVVREQRP